MRRSLNQTERREQILDAATRVFVRKGYRHTSISDIIEAAGIARGTFYLYFKSKEAIFLALIDTFFAGIQAIGTTRGLAEWIASFGEDISARMARDLREWFRYFRENRALARIVLREAVAIDERFEERVGQFRSALNADRAQRIQTMQETGVYRTDLDAEFINTCLTGMVYELVLRYVLPDEEPDLDWLIEGFVKFALHGIAAPRHIGSGNEAGPSSEDE
jgi:AcrR family transcriptional regulator